MFVSGGYHAVVGLDSKTVLIRHPVAGFGFKLNPFTFKMFGTQDMMYLEMFSKIPPKDLLERLNFNFYQIL